MYAPQRGTGDTAPVTRLRLRREVPSLRLGHPWVYLDALEPVRGVEPGDLVEVVDRKGAFVGRGFVDPRGPIGARLLARGREEQVDDAWVTARVRAAAS
jgi:23S rRNA (cytosine1962-C5)-methyltransferase